MKLTTMTDKVFQRKFNANNRLAKNYIAMLMNPNRKDTSEEREFFRCMISCSLCNAVMTDARDSHNAVPLSENRCCESCNDQKVIPARINAMLKAA